MTEEEILLNQLASLHREYQERAQPIIDRITSIRALKPLSAMEIMQSWSDGAKIAFAAEIAAKTGCRGEI